MRARVRAHTHTLTHIMRKGCMIVFFSIKLCSFLFATKKVWLLFENKIIQFFACFQYNKYLLNSKYFVFSGHVFKKNCFPVSIILIKNVTNNSKKNHRWLLGSHLVQYSSRFHHMLDCDMAVSGFELVIRSSVHHLTNTHGKGMGPFILLSIG